MDKPIGWVVYWLRITPLSVAINVGLIQIDNVCLVWKMIVQVVIALSGVRGVPPQFWGLSLNLLTQNMVAVVHDASGYCVIRQGLSILQAVGDSTSLT